MGILNFIEGILNFISFHDVATFKVVLFLFSNDILLTLSTHVREGLDHFVSLSVSNS